MMKGLLIFLVLAVAGASAAYEAGLRVKFDVGLHVGRDYFYLVPRTISEAVLQKWEHTERLSGPRPSLVLYCYSDRVLCILFDDEGIMAGLQIGIAKDEFTEAPFDMETMGFREWETTLADGEVKKFWVTYQYFVSDEFLLLSPEERRAKYDYSKTLREGYVWLTGFNGQIDKFSNNYDDIKDSIFTKQACIPWMGRHYYYNMTTNTLCQADTLYPWFALVHSGEVVGFANVVFGKLKLVPSKRDWFERPSELAVRAIVPRGPKCLYTISANPGPLTMHIYYINKPWTLTCLFQ